MWAWGALLQTRHTRGMLSDTVESTSLAAKASRGQTAPLQGSGEPSPFHPLPDNTQKAPKTCHNQRRTITPVISSISSVDMAYYAGEDDFYQDQPDFTDEHMEERLVEALGYHVQDSVNETLINALKHFAQPLRRFGQRELRGRPLLEAGSQPDQLPDLALSQGALKRPLASADILVNMAVSVMQDHGYDVYSSLDTSEGNRESSARPDDLSSSSQSSASDQDQEDPKPSGKSKRKSRNTQERSSSYRKLSFDPENIIHPRFRNQGCLIKSGSSFLVRLKF
ncbi:hypothetical protein NDU88_000255 [Pleurodeles waltl]|uniref:Uncharacterized protein n=1 Tax=Pleurodeles waltl TaxID=8319 RepID=A0AAV7S6F9_PLEWA|nr:hypothetical protein NDU88_000255 [Pleurodeles waltl]